MSAEPPTTNDERPTSFAEMALADLIDAFKRHTCRQPGVTDKRDDVEVLIL